MSSGVWFWAKSHFPPQGRGTCCISQWPWTTLSVWFDTDIKFCTSYELWCDFGPPLTAHHREEAHVVLPNDPEQLCQSDSIQTLNFVPYINPMVWFWASYCFPPQRRATCCSPWWPWTPSSLSTHLTKWMQNIRITYSSHIRTFELYRLHRLQWHPRDMGNVSL